jgi:ABC-type lipoprotein release transport system permease subunit
LSIAGIKLAAGRNFNARITTDTASAYLINETAARRMGWKPEEALGKKIKFWDREGSVIGVVQDFHFRPLTTAIEPFIFRYRPDDGYSHVVVKTNPGQTRQALAAIERFYKKHEHLTAPQYEFVDEALENQYRAQQRTGRVVLYFSALAIFVSCLGLLGLATFTAEQRTKEIGIRKVLGASVGSIVTLLSKDFLRLVGVAIVIASPVAWYAARQWLQDFAYKIELQWWMFAGAGLLAVGIALLTVSYQAIKTALINPVKSLRTE